MASLLLVKLLPRDRFTIESPLPAKEVIRRLEEAVGRRTANYFWERSDEQRFRGSVDGDRFQMRPARFSQNSFRPRIAGRVILRGTGTTIEITMAMHVFTQIFMSLWLSLVALFLVVLGIAALYEWSTDAVPGLVALFCFFAFGSGLCSFGFWNEAGDAKRALLSLLDGTSAP